MVGKKLYNLINKNQNSTYVCSKHLVNIVAVKYIIFMMNKFDVISWPQTIYKFKNQMKNMTVYTYVYVLIVDCHVVLADLPNLSEWYILSLD